MKLLTLDIGTGTQDIYWFNSRVSPENGFKLVLPAPTMIVRRQIQQATRNKRALLLTGRIMGGGPCAWAAEDHAKAGLPIYATPSAARTLNDDLAAVQAAGIQVVSEDEALRLPESVLRIPLTDLDLSLLERALSGYGLSLSEIDGLAAAVFDHGDAPPDVSDRQFRFDYLACQVQRDRRLSTFAFPAQQVPAEMTRLQAVAEAAQGFDGPVFLMDTAPAAVMGALYDPQAAQANRQLVVNLGNFHTIAFQIGPDGIEGLFEHHTGLLDRASLENYLTALAAGTLTHAQVFADHGHGALLTHHIPLDPAASDFQLTVTGPRRSMLAGSSLHPHFAVPFGDMMIAGCFGLLGALADHTPNWREEILAALSSTQSAPPWESD